MLLFLFALVFVFFSRYLVILDCPFIFKRKTQKNGKELCLKAGLVSRCAQGDPPSWSDGLSRQDM